MNAAKGNGSWGRKCGLWDAESRDQSHTGKAFSTLRQAETFWRQSFFHINLRTCLRFWLCFCLALRNYLGEKNSQKYTVNSSQNNNYSDGKGNKTSFGSFSSLLKEKFFIDATPVHRFVVPRCRAGSDDDFLHTWRGWGCTEKSHHFPSSFEVELRSIAACLYGPKSDCVLWHSNARLVGNFPVNPFIAQIPVERTYISVAAGLPYGVCLRDLWLLCCSVSPSEPMPFHVLLLGSVAAYI